MKTKNRNSYPLQWVKSSASKGTGSIEVAPGPDQGVLMRNSRDPDGPVLSFTRAEWASFMCGVEGGEFDDLATEPGTDR